MKLALGTVQFGLNYGVSNHSGKVCQQEVKRILNLAKQTGITTLDTAAAYGDSEQVLGALTESRAFEVVTKVPQLPEQEASVASYIQTSLERLNRKTIETVMFHDANNLLISKHSHDRYQSLLNLKEQGIINKIGVSVYTPQQVKSLVKQFDFDTVQLPLNLLDQRFINTNTLSELKENKVEIHCRSILLQGLLLMSEQELPDYFSPYLNYIGKVLQLAKKLNCSLIELALSIAKHNINIDKIVIGCCSERQLTEILAAYEKSQQLHDDIKTLACSDEQLLIPSNWSLGA